MSDRACITLISVAKIKAPRTTGRTYRRIRHIPAYGESSICWKDYARGNRVKTMALPAEEFLRRFLLHILPAGFVRIRHFGLLANRGLTAKLAQCQALLAAVPPPGPAAPESVATLILRVTGVDLTRCPACGMGRLRLVAVLRPGQLPALDTS